MHVSILKLDETRQWFCVLLALIRVPFCGDEYFHLKILEPSIIEKVI